MAVHWGSVTANTGKYGAYINIYEIANSVNIAENTSRVGVEFHITRSNWGWQTGNSYSGSITINGVTKSFSYSPNWAYSSSGDVTIAYFETPVEHNNDGTKWCNGSATWSTSGTYSCGTASASGGVTLTTIPRATACPNLDGYIESSANITLNPASSSFKHRLYYSYNGKTGYYPSSTEFFANTGSLDLDTSFYDYTPKSSGTGSLTLYTYNSSGTQIGSKTGTITIRCDAEKCKPEISSTLIDINDETVALTGHNEKLVKGYSNVQVTYTITTLNGATLASKTLNGSALGDSPYVINSVSTDTFTIVATDSRGFSTTDVKTNTMVEYIPLALNFNAFRPTPTGSEIKINFTGNYFNDTFGSVANTLALSWKYRILRTSEWTDGGTFVAGTDYTISGNQFYSGTGSSASDISLGTDLFPYNQAYEIAIFFADKLVDTYSTKPVPKGKPVLSWEEDLVNVEGQLIVSDLDVINSLINKIDKSQDYSGDLNDIKDTSYYYCASATNMPTDNNGYVFTQVYRSNYMYQIFTDYDTSRIFIRAKINNIWGVWRQILTENTVADYVVEQGDNYIKWASGKLEQWLGAYIGGLEINTKVGNVYCGIAAFGTWEVPFVARPEKFVYSLDVTTARNVWIGSAPYENEIQRPSATSGGKVYIYSGGTTNLWGGMNIHAIGRWK